jgi:mono/diheme cytochrome c family protein
VREFLAVRNRVFLVSRTSFFLGLGAIFLLVVAAGPSSAARSASPATVTVTLGKPSQFKLTIKPKSVAAGTVRFKVTNAGTSKYKFRLCTKPGSAPSATCVGKSTAAIAAHKSASLTVKLSAKGTYSYLITVPANAASSGMKGKLTVKATASGGSTTGTGSTAAGAALFKKEGCGGCHTLAAAHAAGGLGPNLDQLAPSEAVVARQVAAGGGQMPSYSGTLTSAQIKQVAEYVYASTHK